MIEFKIAVDCVIICFDSELSRLKFLCVKRNNEPEKGVWALPGGFVKQTESFEDTARSILLRETGLDKVFLRQLKAYSLTDTTRGSRIASIAFFAFIKGDDFSLSPSRQASKWFYFNDLLSLPFDHRIKLEAAMSRIKEIVRLEPVVSNLLPSKFPLNQLQRFYEEIFGQQIDNRNFRKKIKKLPHIEKLDEVEKNVSHRPGSLYRFNLKKYQENLNLF